MEKKRRERIKLGQVWRAHIYTSGMSDNEFQGYVYYIVSKKQSGGYWKLTQILKDPKDLRIGYDKYGSHWIKHKDILESLEPVEDVEPFKAAIVLYG